MTIEQMYNLYKQSREKTGAKPASDWVYRDNLWTQFKISFHHRNRDPCATCMSYTNSNEEEKSQKQEEYDRHIREKKLVAVIKEEAKQGSSGKCYYASAAFDLEGGALNAQSFCWKCLLFEKTEHLQLYRIQLWYR